MPDAGLQYLPRAEMSKEKKTLVLAKPQTTIKRKQTGTSKGIIGSHPYLTNIPNSEQLLESLP
jgi:hypothetical protein